MPSTEIEVSGLGYAVGGVKILEGVDVGVRGSEITAVVGPSGAGKSTLLRAINRLIEPSSGEVYLDGQPTRYLDPLELRQRVGMVFQIPVLFGGAARLHCPYSGPGAGGTAARRADEHPRRDRTAQDRGTRQGSECRLGLTMVLVSHDLAQVERVADRVVVLAEGKSVGAWHREDFFSGADKS